MIGKLLCAARLHRWGYTYVQFGSALNPSRTLRCCARAILCLATAQASSLTLVANQFIGEEGFRIASVDPQAVITTEPRADAERRSASHKAFHAPRLMRPRDTLRGLYA